VARLARRGGVRPAELQQQLLSSNACTSSLCTCATDTACCLPPGKDLFLRLHGGGSFEKREQLLLWQLQVVAARKWRSTQKLQGAGADKALNVQFVQLCSLINSRL
jgi:hypothetical protein